MILSVLAMRILWPIDRALALLGFIGVWAYRRYVSSRKGFRCAVAALTQEPSCSDIALEAFRGKTFSQALPDIRLQFARCRKTYAEYSRDLLNSANAHLATFAALGTVGAISCCPGGDGGGPPPI